MTKRVFDMPDGGFIKNTYQRIFGLRVEDPKRIFDFIESLHEIVPANCCASKTLGSLLLQLDKLALAEICYYYRRRRSCSRWSVLLRLFPWLLGSLGILIPLISAPAKIDVAGWGYVLLALAAAFLGANSLFGATTGHIRFVSSQLALERLVVTTRVRWIGIAASVKVSPLPDERVIELINLLEAYARDLFSLTTSETQVWGSSILEELKKLEQQIAATQQTSAKAGADQKSEGVNGKPTPPDGAKGSPKPGPLPPAA